MSKFSTRLDSWPLNKSLHLAQQKLPAADQAESNLCHIVQGWMTNICMAHTGGLVHKLGVAMNGSLAQNQVYALQE